MTLYADRSEQGSTHQSRPSNIRHQHRYYRISRKNEADFLKCKNHTKNQFDLFRLVQRFYELIIKFSFPMTFLPCPVSAK